MIETFPAREQDRMFEFEVFVSAKLSEMKLRKDPLYGSVSEAELESLMAKAFHAKRRELRMRYPGLRYEIVKYGDIPIGTIATDETGDVIDLADLAIIKPFRNLGIGTRLIRGLLRHAERQGKPVRVFLEAGSPALRLFLRNGFELENRIAARLELVWKPKIGSTPVIAE